MSENSRRPSRGPMGRGRMNGEKAKDFSGAVKKLLRYMSKYKIRLIGMMIFAIVGTVFNIVGPKILGKATTELFNGLVAKVNETGGIEQMSVSKSSGKAEVDNAVLTGVIREGVIPPRPAGSEPLTMRLLFTLKNN